MERAGWILLVKDKGKKRSSGVNAVWEWVGGKRYGRVGTQSTAMKHETSKREEMVWVVRSRTA